MITSYQMSARESLYLDLVRALAACAVVLDHAPSAFDINVPRWGHQAVIVFFVLSGYVIAHTMDHREHTARAYLVARFSRCWSVLVPAMVLTIVCDMAGRHLGWYPKIYNGIPADHPVVRALAVLGFLSETWVSIQPFSNGVVWSLCAEFWYYMFFACYCFLPPGRCRVTALLVACLFAGHKALLLLPVWLFGVALQRLHYLRKIGTLAHAVVFGIGTFAFVWVLATRAYDPAIAAMQRLVSPYLITQLAQARVFWADWLLGLAVAAHFLGARVFVTKIPLETIATPIRFCAGVSFVAYLVHEPLLNFWSAWFPRQYGWVAVGLTFAMIGLIGRPIEASKKQWRLALNFVADWVEMLLPRARQAQLRK